jgi:hypothetical protein
MLAYQNTIKSAAHLKIRSKDTQSNLESFVDCGEGIKKEIKVEETLDEDPLSIQIKAEENIVAQIKEEIDEEDPLTVLQNSGEEGMNIIDIVHHEIESDNVKTVFCCNSVKLI